MYRFETRDGFQVPELRYQAKDLGVYPRDLTGMLYSLVGFAQERGWLPSINDLNGLVAYRKGDLPENSYEADLLSLEYELQQGSISIQVRKSRHSSGRGDFHVGGELVVSVGFLSPDYRARPSVAIYLDFVEDGGYIYQTSLKAQINPEGDVKSEHVY